MSTFLVYKIYFKLIRILNFEKSYFRILSGPNNGLKLKIVSSTNDFLFGEYESLMIASVGEFLSKNITVIDAGANIGYMSLYFSKHSNKVYAVEPIPSIFSSLQDNISINRINNIEACNFAFSNEIGVVEFSNLKNNHGNTYIKESYKFKGNKKTISVKTTTVDTFIKDRDIRGGLVIKIDVEGAEYDMLLGAKETLKTRRPIIILATHDCHIDGIRDKCLTFLKLYNYRIVPTGEKKVTAENMEDFICLPE